MLSTGMKNRMIKNTLRSFSKVFVAFLVPLTLNGVAYSKPEFQPHQHLTSVAENFLEDYYRGNVNSDGTGLQLQITPLDSRVNLKHCDQDPEAFWPYEPSNKRKISIGIRCTGAVRWKVFLQAKIKRIQSVAVLNSPVSVGDVLSERIISMQETDTLGLRAAAVDDVTDLLGMTFKKHLRPGAVLSRQHLEIALSVKRGDIVDILSGSGSIAVRAQGISLDDGHLNELIKVRNSTSKQIVQATVIKTGTVQIVQ